MLTIIHNVNTSKILKCYCSQLVLILSIYFIVLINSLCLKQLKVFLSPNKTNFHQQLALIKPFNYSQNATILFQITNISQRVTVQHKFFRCHVLIVILPFNILMLKLQNALQQLSVGCGLGMALLLLGQIILMNSIYFFII